MPKQTVGYEAFAKWEIELAAGKARGLIGKYGFTSEDAKDLEQELLLQIHITRKAKDSWISVTASEKTILNRILDNRVRNIIRDSRREKRKENLELKSLHQEIKQKNSEDVFTYEDILDEDRSLARAGKKKIAAEEELRLGFSLVTDSLSDLQKRICDLFMQGMNIGDVAETLQIPRHILKTELARMRKVLYRRGLSDYL